MSPIDPDESPSERDVRHGRHRARHADAAPDAYREDEYGYEYGDGVSAHPMYGRVPGAGSKRSATQPRPSAPATGPQSTPSPTPPVNRPLASSSGSPFTPAALNSAPPAMPAFVPPTTRPGPVRRRPDQPPTGIDERAAEPTRTEPTRTEPTRTEQIANDLPPLRLNLDEQGSITGQNATDGDTTDSDATGPAPKKSRAGRNLPAAIGVGLLLAGIVLGSLFLWRPAFVAVLAVAAGVGVWEMVRAISAVRVAGGTPRAEPPLIPLLGGCLIMPVLAWYGGVQSLTLGLLVTVLAVMVWRLSTGPAGFARDMAAAGLIAIYVPFLIGFGVLLAVPRDGDMRVLVVLACVILSDTGGYAAGVFLGQHPMAPSVSPKKSWEGFGGSLAATAIGGAVLMDLVLHQPWWHGALLGLGVSAAAVLGDLAESLLKRDLGIKDMSALLPGHGGLMDRLDSVVFAAPAAYMLMILLAPVGT